MIELTTIGGHLIFLGVLFFVIGLIQGLLIPFAKNTRMALSGHLTAVQCGLAVIVFGLIWSLVQLAPVLAALAAYGSFAGYFLIWIGITIASITGASKTLPIAGAGHKGSPAAELTVRLFEIAGSLLSVVAGVILLMGLAHLVTG